MGKKRKGESVLVRAADTFDLPADIVAGLPRMEILGNHELFLGNHKGILSYDGTQIDVGGDGVVIRIVGEDLELRAMNADELRISGRIGRVEFVL